MILLSDELHISVENLFTGPFDLLLHLVRRHEIDLMEVPVSLLVEEYLKALKAMERLDIEIASEFLLMAAYLVEWKARMLLPSPANDEDRPEEDFGRQWVERLIRYHRYRTAAQKLLERSRGAIWPRGGSIDVTPLEPEIAPMPKEELTNTMAGLMKLQRLKDSRRYVQMLPIRATMQRILKVLDSKKRVFLRQLIVRPRRTDVVVTFLAVLELTVMGMTRIVGEGLDLQIHRVDPQDAREGT